METLDADLLEKLEVDLLEKLKESGRVHSLELLRSDIRNYNNLKAELSRIESEYAMGLLPYREKIDQANAELEKIKSPGHGDGLGGYVETLDKKIIRLEEQKAIASQEIKTYMSTNNYTYYNRKWVLMSRISIVEKTLELMKGKDREFIIDLYVEPIGFKKVMSKYKIENNGDVYRKASNILRRIL